MTFLRDITERKQAEARIQTLNADLERRVEERTAQLYASETRLSHILLTTSGAARGITLGAQRDTESDTAQSPPGVRRPNRRATRRRHTTPAIPLKIAGSFARPTAIKSM